MKNISAISAKTKISDLLEKYPESLENIISLSKHFRKLQNTVLRKLLAKRVSIADAARIGGISTNDFLLELKKSGYTVHFTETGITQVKQTKQDIQISKNMEIIEFDVRPIISGGKDPFKDINAKLAELPTGKTLKVINSFVPAPLISILEKKGYKISTEQISDNLIYTFITKENDNIEALGFDKNVFTLADKTDFQAVRKAFGDNVKEIDVRNLEMPEPMITILNELSVLPSEYCLFVNHKRIPQYLIPELEERGFMFTALEIAENDVKILIYKKEL